jgi:hypothetical protein
MARVLILSSVLLFERLFQDDGPRPGQGGPPRPGGGAPPAAAAAAPPRT